jgi:hypothetical protein
VAGADRAAEEWPAHFAAWGSREQLVVMLVEPGLVVEVGVDAARDTSGR